MFISGSSADALDVIDATVTNIAARVAQGAFGALLIPQGMAIMTKAFDRDMLAKAFGFFGPVLGLSSVGGPVLAGFIISADLFGLSWRPIFLANIILGIIGLVMAVKILPRDDEGDRSAVVDGWGCRFLPGISLQVLLSWGSCRFLIDLSSAFFSRTCRFPRR